MHLTKSFQNKCLALVAASNQCLPTHKQVLFESADSLKEILLFDSPAFPDPANPGNTMASLPAFVFLPRTEMDLVAVNSEISAFLSSFGEDVDESLNIFDERIKLFGAIGLAGKSATISVPGCSNSVQTRGTSDSDLGMSLTTASLGQCGESGEFVATALLGDNKSSNATIFSSPNSGFGVISDIDDTVKISHVLDKVALLKATFLEEPQHVPGMPELYTSLATSLNNPQFVYVSGSPFQLFPFLHDFIDTTYSTAKGPILSRNLSSSDPSQALQFFIDGLDDVEAFKLSQIDLLQGMYPNKKWLAIGDSTERDPEVYGESLRRFGDSIACGWIRRVDGANNTDERFAAAFAGVPITRFRIYTDADIPSLANINVVGGEC